MAKSRDAFRTISEVADWLETPAHVLRFWESKFPQIKPVKRAGGRRYYRPEDMALLGGIKTLLHEDGLTIKGAQKLLREKGVRHVSSLGPSPLDAEDGEDAAIEGQLTPPDAAVPGGAMAESPAVPAEAPPEAPAPEPEAEREALPAFLRRSAGMATPVAMSDPAAAEPGPSEDAPSTDAPEPPDHAEDAAEDQPADGTAASMEPDAEDDPAGAPRPDFETTESALAAEPPGPPAPHPAIPETAELLTALATTDKQDPKEPRVIHETHDAGTEWQPELPFGSLRPEPPRPAAKPRRAAARTAAAKVEPVPENTEAEPRPGLLSLLASADHLAADPARLSAALARLEALRDRPRS